MLPGNLQQDYARVTYVGVLGDLLEPSYKKEQVSIMASGEKAIKSFYLCPYTAFIKGLNGIPHATTLCTYVCVTEEVRLSCRKADGV